MHCCFCTASVSEPDRSKLSGSLTLAVQMTRMVPVRSNQSRALLLWAGPVLAFRATVDVLLHEVRELAGIEVLLLQQPAPRYRRDLCVHVGVRHDQHPRLPALGVPPE